MIPMIVGPCDEDPPTPEGQTGTPVALRTWDPLSMMSRVAIDDEGRRYIVGAFDTPLTFGDQTFDPETATRNAFVAALAPDGALLWLHQFHSDGDGVRPRALTLGDDGFLYMGAQFGQPLWIDGTEVIERPTGVGNTFVAKFAADTGEQQWIRTITGSNEARVTDIATIAGGAIVAAVEWQAGSWTYHDDDPIVTMGGIAWVGIADDGEALWWREGTWQDAWYLNSAALRTVDGGVISLFRTTGFGDGTPVRVDVDGTVLSHDSNEVSYLVDLAEDGEVRSAEALELPGDVIVLDGAVAPCEDLVLVGTWSGALDLGSGPLGSHGAFVWRRDPDGNTRWSVGEVGEHRFGHVAIDANAQATVAAVSDQGHITRYSSAGEPLWDVVVDNGVNNGFADALAIEPGGGTVVGGFYHSLDVPGFDSVPYTLDHGMFVVDLAP